MFSDRRTFLEAMVPAGLLLIAGSSAGQRSASPMQQPGQGPVVPNTPSLGDANNVPIDSKRLLKANQQKIEDDVLKLFTLASELRDQVKSTDSASVLSLALMQKAEEVEKLAHQIRTLAKG
jgi:hypothetical protein